MKKILFLALCITSTVFGANGVHRDGAKGIVIDTRTGLVWQDEPYTAAEATAYGANTESGKVLYWSNAIAYCENLVLGGYSDWRLPNINELKSIRDMSRSSPAIDTAFVNTATDGYWSSTSYAADTTHAWDVYFYHGDVNYNDKGVSNYVRCVRGN